MNKEDDLSRHQYNLSQITDAKIDLRSVAEASILKEEKLNCENPEKLSLKEINVVIHELKVHQIELEMQNEELKRIQLELEQAKARYFDIYDLAPEGYLIISEKGLILEANLTAAMMLGLPRINLIKQQISQYICKEDQDNYYLYSKKLFKTLKPEVCELRMKRDDGTIFWGRMKPKVITEEGLTVCRIILSDVTDYKQSEAKITHLASFPRLNPNLTIELNQDGSINYANPAAKNSFPDLESVGTRHPFLVNWQTVVAQLSAQENDPLVRETMVGDCIYLQTFQYIESSKTIRIYSQNITDRKQAENALKESENLFRTSFEIATTGIVMIGKNGICTMMNDRACELWGYTREELLQLKLNDITYEEDQGIGTDFFKKLISGEINNTVFEKRYIRKDKKVIWALVSISAIHDNHNEFQYFISSIQDITDSKEKEKRAAELTIANKELSLQNKKILYLNYHDYLTGLYNRIYFEEEKKRLDTPRQLPISIIMGDINGLKLINDGFGHPKGDEVLIEIAKILKNCCRKEDIVSRIGGDEFGILLPKTDSQSAQRICNRIYDTCKGYALAGSSICPSISVGYATKNISTETMNNILMAAEESMSRHKLLESKSAHSSIIASIKVIMFEKSQETEEHAERMVQLSKSIGLAMSLSEDQLNELELAATLHDIGKMSIDAEILSKPGRLSDEEWVEMRKHPEVGFRIAQATSELVPIAKYILCHHERWDGKGYPQGLIGEKIPLLSRIVAIVDSFDAMTNDRAYRSAMTKGEAIEEIRRNSGTQFDPEVTRVFIEKVLGQEWEQLNKI